MGYSVESFPRLRWLEGVLEEGQGFWYVSPVLIWSLQIEVGQANVKDEVIHHTISVKINIT